MEIEKLITKSEQLEAQRIEEGAMWNAIKRGWNNMWNGAYQNNGGNNNGGENDQNSSTTPQDPKTQQNQKLDQYIDNSFKTFESVLQDLGNIIKSQPA